MKTLASVYHGLRNERVRYNGREYLASAPVATHYEAGTLVGVTVELRNVTTGRGTSEFVVITDDMLI